MPTPMLGHRLSPLVLLGTVSCLSPTDDAVESTLAAWNRFRGPNGTGVAEGSGYPAAIGPDPTRLSPACRAMSVTWPGAV